MKIIHLSDLHLGKTIGDFDLFDDQKYILDQILSIIKQESVDTVLIAGDVYDKSVPSESATYLLDYFFSQLAKVKVNTFVISGNHDSDERLNYANSFFESQNIHIYTKFDGKLRKFCIQDEFGNVNIYLLPFVKASQVKYYFPDSKIESYDDAVRVIIDSERIDTMQRNIILAHQFVSGSGEDPKLGGSEGASVLNVGLVEKISWDCFDCFDYAALGHIHSSQKIGRDEIRYAGSLLKYSISETGNDKSVSVVTLGAKGNVLIKLIPLSPMRDLRHIKGPIEKLLAKENILDTEDFIYATLTNEEFVNDAMSIFQQIYPNTVKIDYDNSHTKEIEQADISKITENKSFKELVSDFYELIYDSRITDEEMAVMSEVAKEAGVIDETD